MKKDLFLSFVVLFQLVLTTFQLLLPLYGIATIELASKLRILVTILTYIPAAYIIFKRRPSLVILPFIVYAIILLFNYLLFPDSHTFIESSNAYTLTPISILTMIIMIGIKDFGCFQKVLLYLSRICPFIGLLYVYGSKNFVVIDADYAYSMSFGYSFLLPALYLFYQEKLIDKVLSLLLFVLIVVDGSRGPVVVTGLFYLYEILFSSNKYNRLGTIFIFLVISATSLFYVSQLNIMDSSRTVMLIRNGEFVSHDSGREEILYLPAMREIEKSPIVGHGIGSDRKLIGFYVHNIFLEVFLHYGLFGGGILFFLFFFFCIKSFFNKQIVNLQGGRNVFIMIFMFGFLPLLVSSSYLLDFGFAVLIGYIVRCQKVKRTALKKTFCANNVKMKKMYN